MTTMTTRAGAEQLAGQLRPERGRRTVGAVLLAVLLLAGAVAVGWAATLLALGRSVTLVDLGAAVRWSQQTRWTDTVVLVAGIVVAVIGLLVLLGALVPPARRGLELTAVHPRTATSLTRRSLRRTLAAAVEQLDGVSGATAALGRGVVRVDATSWLRHPGSLQQDAVAAVEHRLDLLDLKVRPRVEVRLLDRGL